MHDVRGKSLRIQTSKEPVEKSIKLVQIVREHCTFLFLIHQLCCIFELLLSGFHSESWSLVLCSSWEAIILGFQLSLCKTEPKTKNRTENQKPNQKNQTETKFWFFQVLVSVSVSNFKNHIAFGFSVRIRSVFS